MKNRAFSLIEAMVVVGIIALLATIAVPFYADYMNKSKVALAAVVLNELNTKAMALYNEGLITNGMTELNLDGVTWTDNVSISYDRAPVEMAEMLMPGDGVVSSNAWMFCVYVADLSFSGYGGAGGDHSRLCSKVTVNDGIFQTSCGTRDENGSLEIPLEYLPEECNVNGVL